MKTMVSSSGLVLEQLRHRVQPFPDPLRFTYQPRLGGEDAIIYLLNHVSAHLDKPASTVRVMFLTSPEHLTPFVQIYWVKSPQPCGWIVDHLTGRRQYVSDGAVSDTGAPQGTVLSPFLFTLYTTDFNYCTET